MRRFFWYGTSRGITDALLAFRGLALATLLGPAVFGAWALFRLAARYAVFLGLGVPRGMEYEVARLGPEREAAIPGSDHLGAALGFVLVVYGAVAALAVGISFAVGSTSWTMGLRWFAAAVFVEQVWSHQMVYLRARGNLRDYAVHEVVNAALHSALTPAFAVVWGLAGAFAGYVLAYLVGLVFLLARTPVVPRLSRLRTGQHLRVGFPILVALLVSTGLATADRFVVVSYGGVALLGRYAFAVALAGLAGSVVWVVRTLVFPSVYAQTDAAAPQSGLGVFVRTTLRPFARLFPPLLGVFALLIEPVVALAFPQYREAVPAARLFVFSGATTGFAALGAVAVVAAGQQRALPLYSAAALALNVALSAGALAAGLGLEGVALAALVSSAIYGASVLRLVAIAAGLRSPARFLFSTLAPLGWCVTCVLALGYGQPNDGVLAALATLALYLLALLPLAGVIAAEVRVLLGSAAPAMGRTHPSGAERP